MFMQPPGLKVVGNFIELVVAMVRDDGMCLLTYDCRSCHTFVCDTSRLCSAKPMMSASMEFMLSRIMLSRSWLWFGLIPLTFA